MACCDIVIFLPQVKILKLNLLLYLIIIINKTFQIIATKKQATVTTFLLKIFANNYK